jgi:hypothetical protein
VQEHPLLHLNEIVHAKATDPEIRKTRLIKIALILSFILAGADTVYKSIQNISYLNRSKCILYKTLPKIGFLIFEYMVELSILVFIGIFLAALLEKYFLRFKRFLPENPVSAFIYASLLPVCACAAVPFVKTMQEKMKFNILVTFLVAAPLLNPYIIFLSFNVLGVKYGVARIVSSFILAVSSGYLLACFNRKQVIGLPVRVLCGETSCGVTGEDIYLKTYSLFKSIFPYILLAGVIAIGLEMLSIKKSIIDFMRQKSLLGNIAVIFASIPLYLCNGTDILLLRPLICAGVPLGNGIAFSLASSAICISSILMLIKFIGLRLTLILVAHIIGMTLILSQLINLLL